MSTRNTARPPRSKEAGGALGPRWGAQGGSLRWVSGPTQTREPDTKRSNNADERSSTSKNSVRMRDECPQAFAAIPTMLSASLFINICGQAPRGRRRMMQGAKGQRAESCGQIRPLPYDSSAAELQCLHPQSSRLPQQMMATSAFRKGLLPTDSLQTRKVGLLIVSESCKRTDMGVRASACWAIKPQSMYQQRLARACMTNQSRQEGRKEGVTQERRSPIRS